MLILACYPLSLSVAFYELSAFAFLCTLQCPLCHLFIFYFPNKTTKKNREMGLFSKKLGKSQVQILKHRCPRRWGDAGKCKFLSVSKHWPMQTATSTRPPASVAFCSSAVWKCFLAQGTAAHTAALHWLMPCWPATKGEECWNVDLTTARLLSCSAYFPVPHVGSMWR